MDVNLIKLYFTDAIYTFFFLNLDVGRFDVE